MNKIQPEQQNDDQKIGLEIPQKNNQIQNLESIDRMQSQNNFIQSAQSQISEKNDSQSLEEDYDNLDCKKRRKIRQSKSQNIIVERDKDAESFQNSLGNRVQNKEQKMSDLEKDSVFSSEGNEKIKEFIKKKIRNFINQLEVSKEIFRLKNLKSVEVNILDDKCIDEVNLFELVGAKRINFREYSQLMIFRKNTDHSRYCIQMCFSALKVLKNKLIDKISHLPVINPNNSQIYFYYFINLISSFFLIFLVSIRWGYIYEQDSMPFFEIFKKFSIALYILEIFLNFNVGYFEMGRKIIDRQLIVQNYKKGNLKYDVIVILSMIYTLYQQTNHWDCIIMDQFIYLKLISFVRIKRLLEERFLKYDQSNPVYGLINLVFLCTICSHITGIGWHLLNQYEILYNYHPKIWLYFIDIADTPWDVRFINSFYWSLNTMITGGVRPETIAELYYTTVITLYCVFLFSYVIMQVGMTLDELTKKSLNYRRQMIIVNKFMSVRNFAEELQLRVINFLKYSQQEDFDMDQQEELGHIMKKLPEALRNDIQQEQANKYKSQFGIIKTIFGEKVFNELGPIIKEEQLIPNQVIIQPFDNSFFGLFSVHKGEVEIFQQPLFEQRFADFYSEEEGELFNSQNQFENNRKKPGYHAQSNLDDSEQNFNLNFQKQNVQKKGSQVKNVKLKNSSQKVIKVLQKPNLFGFKGFFKGNIQYYGYKSKGFSTVYKINREDFLKILDKHPIEYEKFAMIREQLLMDENPENIQIQMGCRICNKSHRMEEGCPQIQYVASKDKIIRKYSNQKNLRDPLYKNRKPKRLFKKKIQFFINDNNFEIFDKVYGDSFNDLTGGTSRSKTYKNSSDEKRKIKKHVEFLKKGDIQQQIWKNQRIKQSIDSSDEENDLLKSSQQIQEIQKINTDQNYNQQNIRTSQKVESIIYTKKHFPLEYSNQIIEEKNESQINSQQFIQKPNTYSIQNLKTQQIENNSPITDKNPFESESASASETDSAKNEKFQESQSKKEIILFDGNAAKGSSRSSNPKYSIKLGKSELSSSENSESDYLDDLYTIKKQSSGNSNPNQNLLGALNNHQVTNNQNFKNRKSVQFDYSNPSQQILTLQQQTSTNNVPGKPRLSILKNTREHFDKELKKATSNQNEDFKITFPSNNNNENSRDNSSSNFLQINSPQNNNKSYEIPENIMEIYRRKSQILDIKTQELKNQQKYKENEEIQREKQIKANENFEKFSKKEKSPKALINIFQNYKNNLKGCDFTEAATIAEINQKDYINTRYEITMDCCYQSEVQLDSIKEYKYFFPWNNFKNVIIFQKIKKNFSKNKIQRDINPIDIRKKLNSRKKINYYRQKKKSTYFVPMMPKIKIPIQNYSNSFSVL